MKSYTITEYIERDAPRWLSDWIDWGGVRIIRRIVDGHVKVKGVRIGRETAKIGDRILYDGKRPSIERR